MTSLVYQCASGVESMAKVKFGVKISNRPSRYKTQRLNAFRLNK